MLALGSARGLRLPADRLPRSEGHQRLRHQRPRARSPERRPAPDRAPERWRAWSRSEVHS